MNVLIFFDITCRWNWFFMMCKTKLKYCKFMSVFNEIWRYRPHEIFYYIAFFNNSNFYFQFIDINMYNIISRMNWKYNSTPCVWSAKIWLKPRIVCFIILTNTTFPSVEITNILCWSRWDILRQINLVKTILNLCICGVLWKIV